MIGSACPVPGDRRVRQGGVLGLAVQLEEPARVGLRDLVQGAVVCLDRLIELSASSKALLRQPSGFEGFREMTASLSPERGQPMSASINPARTPNGSVGDVEGAGRGISDPRVVLVQDPVGESRGWGTWVRVVPNGSGIRIRAHSPRHTGAVMNGESGSRRYSQSSSHDRPGNQLPQLPHLLWSAIGDSVPRYTHPVAPRLAPRR
jgi:hypothetical protein